MASLKIERVNRKIVPKGHLAELPDKPSDLIRLAVKDLKRAERSDQYVIDMGSWHETNGHCSVCFAGAVMATGLPKQDANVTPDNFPLDVRNKLLALNYFRTGDVEDGVKLVDRALLKKLPQCMRSRDVSDYNYDDPQWFHDDMLELADDLKTIGL